MSRLFSAYVVVDWSAAAAPKTGKDSIWIGVLKKDVRFRLTFEAHNPPTRAAAAKDLDAILGELKRKSERVLLGFDFSLGFPRGAVKALGLKQADWSGLWSYLARELVDKPNNVNNRFAMANKMNRLMTDRPLPFWGCPPKDAQTWLSVSRPDDWPGPFPALRHAEEACGAKSVWQLTGAGSVGSQSLVGIPYVQAIVKARGDKARVWPFETGWRGLSETDLTGVEVLVAEVYPSLFQAKPEGAEIMDRAQVRAACEHFARLDEQGLLGAAFGPAKAPTDDLRDIVETEEGWILGC